MDIKNIAFDMDGTIADFYGVEHWLDYLQNEMVIPYLIARPLLNMRVLARRLNALQNLGFTIEIISWSSKNASADFDKRVELAKMKWLKKHLGSVKWNKISVVPYGSAKEKCSIAGGGVLFDDEIANRNNWNGIAYDEKNILEILKEIQNEEIYTI